MNYPQALAWLYKTQQSGIRPGLENIRRLLDALEFSGSGQRFLHVAGTNGKGSVCAMMDAICRAEGLRTGLFTSPHLVNFRERIQLNGEMISEEDVMLGLSRIRAIIQDLEEHPTFFEITTALALDYFQRQNADVVILETGLGGRLDATNTVTPVSSVITAIDLDHQAWLGSTIEQIAFEKAGIIKPGVPVVSAPQREEAAGVLVKTAAEKNAPFEFVHEPDPLSVGLAGSHQKLNASLARAALRAGGIAVSPESIRSGLRDVAWPGRFQAIETQRQRMRSNGRAFQSKIKNPLVLDGAHNEAAALRLAQTWQEVYGDEKATLVLGILKDKSMEAICRALLPVAAGVVLTPVRNPRTSTPDELLAILRELAPSLDCKIAGDFAEAVEIADAQSRRILVTGSLFLVGEALAYFDPTADKPEITSQ